MKAIRNHLRGRPSLPALVLLVTVMSLLKPDFATARNGITIMRQVSILGITACGLMLVLLCGHIDLSVGAFASFGCVLFAKLVSSDYADIHPALAVFIVLAVCAAMGLLKAALVIVCTMPSVIATLGVATLFNGINYLMTNARIITHLNESVIFLGQGYIGFVPWTTILFAIITAATSFVLRLTYLGRYIYATGANPKATQLAGISVRRVLAFSYSICTLLAGFGGIILCCRVKGGQATAGDTYQMNTLTACAVGGISFSGGRGSVFDAVCGVLLIGVITNSMTILGLNAYWQEVVQGFVLIVAVAADYMQRNRANPVRAPKRPVGKSEFGKI